MCKGLKATTLAPLNSHIVCSLQTPLPPACRSQHKFYVTTVLLQEYLFIRYPVTLTSSTQADSHHPVQDPLSRETSMKANDLDIDWDQTDKGSNGSHPDKTGEGSENGEPRRHRLGKAGEKSSAKRHDTHGKWGKVDGF